MVRSDLAFRLEREREQEPVRLPLGLEPGRERLLLGPDSSGGRCHLERQAGP